MDEPTDLITAALARIAGWPERHPHEALHVEKSLPHMLQEMEPPQERPARRHVASAVRH
jgi:hypothetical protein